MIIGYFGNVRQGKTLSAVRELYKFYLKGYKIYSNTFLNFPFTPLTMEMLFDVVEKDFDIGDQSVFFIDEAHIWMDSRVSGTKRNRIVSYFLLQTGKLGKSTDYGLILLFTSQYAHQIDKRLRSVIDIAVECTKFEHPSGKYFYQEINVFKGKKSYKKSKVFKGMPAIYELYDTRKKIKLERDRYTKDV